MRITTSASTDPSHAQSSDPVGRPTSRPPDQVADHVGGLAARLRRADGSAVPGDLYLLMATVGSEDRARLFEQTAFTHDSGPHADSIESNQLAAEAARAITGIEIERVDLTTAPDGGPSGGLPYLIAYLNMISEGAFTGDLRVAATGELESEHYVAPVRAASEKLAAARLAGAEVLFTSSAPSHAALAEHAERSVGQAFRSRHGRVTIEVERQLDDYEGWGASRPDGLDLVVVGHVADVAAYLCGAGSVFACVVADHLGATTTTDELTAYDLVRLSADAPIEQPLDQAGSGSPR